MPGLVGPVVPPGTLAAREQPTLGTGTELLRPWSPNDAAAVREAFADPDISRWHRRSMSSEAEAMEWIEGWRPAWREERDASWAVTEAGTDRLLGYAALRGLSLSHGHAQVTYWVLPDARLRGVASRAARAVTRWAMDELQLHRLELRHSILNAPSCRVAERLGYALEGTLVKAMLHTDGWHDTHLHARVHR